MRIERIARDAPQPPPLGAIYGVVLAAAAGVAAVWLTLGLPRPVCLFHEWTGWPCPGCGSTRTVEALLGGDVAAAVGWNPLTFAAICAMALWALLSGGRWLLGLPARRVVLSPAEWKVVRVTAVGVIVAGWIYLFWRGV